MRPAPSPLLRTRFYWHADGHVLTFVCAVRAARGTEREVAGPATFFMFDARMLFAGRVMLRLVWDWWAAGRGRDKETAVKTAALEGKAQRRHETMENGSVGYRWRYRDGEYRKSTGGGRCVLNGVDMPRRPSAGWQRAAQRCHAAMRRRGARADGTKWQRVQAPTIAETSAMLKRPPAVAPVRDGVSHVAVAVQQPTELKLSFCANQRVAYTRRKCPLEKERPDTLVQRETVRRKSLHGSHEGQACAPPVTPPRRRHEEE